MQVLHNRPCTILSCRNSPCIFCGTQNPTRSLSRRVPGPFPALPPRRAVPSGAYAPQHPDSQAADTIDAAWVCVPEAPEGPPLSPEVRQSAPPRPRLPARMSAALPGAPLGNAFEPARAGSAGGAGARSDRPVRRAVACKERLRWCRASCAVRLTWLPAGEVAWGVNLRAARPQGGGCHCGRAAHEAPPAGGGAASEAVAGEGDGGRGGLRSGAGGARHPPAPLCTAARTQRHCPPARAPPPPLLAVLCD